MAEKSLKPKKVVRRRTPEERAEETRQRNIRREAHRVQDQLDQEILHAKVPELVGGMFEVDTEDIPQGDLYIEYIQSWHESTKPKAKLLVKTYEGRLSLTTIRTLAEVTDKLGLTCMFQADPNDRDYIALEILVVRGEEPSPEAIKRATEVYDQRQAAKGF